MITVHARLRQTNRRTNRQTNIMVIAQRFVLTNASRAKNQTFCMLYRIVLCISFCCKIETKVLQASILVAKIALLALIFNFIVHWPLSQCVMWCVTSISLQQVHENIFQNLKRSPLCYLWMCDRQLPSSDELYCNYVQSWLWWCYKATVSHLRLCRLLYNCRSITYRCISKFSLISLSLSCFFSTQCVR